MLTQLHHCTIICKLGNLHTFNLTYVLAHLLTWIFINLHTCILTYLYTCIIVYLHTCSLAYLHTYIYAYLSICIPAFIKSRIRYHFSESGVPPNSVLFCGTVPPNSVLFGGTDPPNSFPLTFYTIIIRLEMTEIPRKTIQQLATAFLGDQLVASLLANQTNQVEYTIYTEFQLPTKSKSVLSDALAVAVAV